MESRTLPAAFSAPDPEQLRYVTEHFNSLQGLTWVVFGTMFMLEDITLRLGWLSDVPLFGPFLLFGLVVVAIRYVQGYYRRRFGWVEPRTPSNKQVVIFVVVMLVPLIFGRDIEHSSATSLVQYVQSKFHPAHQVNLWAAAGWMLFLCLSLRRHPQQEERHRTYFLLLGTIAWSLVALSPLWWPDVTQLMFWKILSAEGIGLSLVAVGIYDHMTLARLLPQRIPQDANEGNNDEQ
jgi:hypothetical protein